MRRTYSASPWERFFTGGGLHQFANFNPDHNGRTMSVARRSAIRSTSCSCG